MCVSDILHLFKNFRVDMEKWKKRSGKRKGVYVSPLVTGLPFKRLKSKVC